MTSDAIKILKASSYYSDMLDSFSSDDKLNDVNLDDTAITEAIFFHICKMKSAGWRHRINFKRSRKHSIADLFKDIIAFYLKATLPDTYTIELEKKVRDTQPDIAIKRDNTYIFLIEVKTNIGWDRPDITANNPYKKFSNRVTKLSNNFKVPTENIIYVFEEHSNVSKDFSEKFWDNKLQMPKARPTGFPFSKIFPLFNATDPYYWKHEKNFKRRGQYVEISDEEIQEQAKRHIVTPFEEVLRKIRAA